MFKKKEHFFRGYIVDESYYFITEWTVNGGDTITLPTWSSGSYAFSVDWGDGTPVKSVTTWNSANASHTYLNSGVYDVKISGICNRFSFGRNNVSRLKITNIKQWGNVEFLQLDFKLCTNLVNVTPNDTPLFAVNAIIENLVSNCVNLVSVSKINEWNTSNVINMINAFGGISYDAPIENWNIENATNLSLMFFYQGGRTRDYSVWNFNKNVKLSFFMYAKNQSPENIDALLIKIASRVIGTGRTETNKYIGFFQAKRTVASTTAFNALVSDGWNFQYAITVV